MRSYTSLHSLGAGLSIILLLFRDEVEELGGDDDVVDVRLEEAPADAEPQIRTVPSSEAKK